MTQIVVLDGYTTNPGDLSWELIEALGELKIYDRTDDSHIIERAAEADIVLTNKTALSSDILQQLPKLKLICVMATGYNIVDTAAAHAQSITVCNVVGYSTPSVVQHTFSLALEIINQAGKYSQEAKSGLWASSKDFSYWHKPIIELEGKVMGIVGFGNIGRSVAIVALAFGMRVIAYHTHPERDGIHGVEFVEFEEVLSESDILSLHCPLKKDNYHMIGDQQLQLMKDNAILINTARGGLVDFDALIRAIELGTIKGAGLDVMESEPPPNEIRFPKNENLVITPHQAWASLESRNRLLKGLAENITAFQTGHPINVVS